MITYRLTGIVINVLCELIYLLCDFLLTLVWLIHSQKGNFTAPQFVSFKYLLSIETLEECFFIFYIDNTVVCMYAYFLLLFLAVCFDTQHNVGGFSLFIHSMFIMFVTVAYYMFNV